MEAKVDQTPATNSNPVLSVNKNGCIVYSNEAGNTLLKEWDVRVGEKLPSNIVDLVQRVTYQNSPEKIETKVGNRIYLVVFSPLPEQECVNISGFDISDKKYLEERIWDSEERFRSAFDDSAVAMALVCPDASLMKVNDAFCRLLGFEKSEMEGSTFLNFTYPDDKEPSIKTHKAVISCEQPFFWLEKRYICKDGRVIWCEVSSSPVFDSKGIPIYTVAHIQDITERKRAEEELRQSEARYRLLHDSLRDAFVQVSMDERIIDFNESYRQMLGYSSEELLTLTVKDLTPESWHAFEDSIVSEQIVSRGYSDIYEKEYRRKDGMVFPVELRTILVRDDAGHPSAMWAIIRDITERKQVEKEVLDTKNMLQLIMDNVPQGIFWKDRNSVYVGCNKFIANLLGLDSPENIVGKTDYDMPWTLEQTEWYRECDRRVMENNTPEYNIIEPQREHDGRLLWLETNKIPLHDAKGNVIGILGTYEDITERKKAEEALSLSNLYNRSLIEASLDPLVTIGRDGKIMDVNTATEKATGYSRNELIGTDFSDYFTEPEKARTGYQQVFIQGEVRDYPLEIQHKNGHITPVLYNASIYRDASGVVIGIFAAARDITEIKKAEAKLKEIQENLEKLVEERTIQLEKAYDSLKESEKGLAEAQKMAHVGSWVWDRATDKAYWSDELYRIFGLNPQEPGANYNEFLNYIHPEDRDDMDNAHKKALNGKPYNLEYRIVLANGEERTVHMECKIIFDENNIPIRLNGIIQDITERKKTEEKIKRLANIVEYTNDGIGLITPEGIVLEWNKGEEHIYGYDAEEILGRHISVLAPPHLKNEPMDYVELIKQTHTSYNYTTPRLRKDGKTIEVSITISPVFDNHGKLTFISFITRDITEQKMYEERLRLSEQKYRNIVETANEGICIINNEFKITYGNKKMEDMFGYSAEESIGKSMWNFLSEESKPIVKEMLEKNLEKGWQDSSESLEIKYIRKDGSPLWAHVNGKSLSNKDGKFIGLMTMITDITERKEAEEALEKIEIARKQEIHHRIKNNLQVISSLLDLQAEHFRNKECIKQSEILEAFRESQNRVISMALIHEELYKGGGFETLNLSPYIQELADTLFQTYRLGNTDVSLSMDLGEDLFLDMDTAVPLGIIINELISNSLKHAFPDRKKGEIQIKLHRNEPTELENEGSQSTSTNFTLTVSDNGIGIPENLDIEKHDSLGMQLVISLVDQLDGELELKRSNGTEFTIRFTVTKKDNHASLPAPYY